MSSTADKWEKFRAMHGLTHQAHQLEAVEWCVDREEHGRRAGGALVRGGLIADEMGLGKTIEIIGTMHCNPLERTLIVVPRALLEQWSEVLARLLPAAPLVYHGAKARKLVEQLSEADVVLTTYGMVGMSKTAFGTPLHEITWSRLVCDEAHHLRNRKTRAHIGVKRLRVGIRWLMTGTPIQNKKSDFYSLCAAMGLPQEFYIQTENLIPFVRDFVLKRTKADVGMELPDLSSELCTVQWKSDLERQFAENIHASLPFSGVIANTTETRNVSGMSMLPLLVKARQACILPQLVRFVPALGHEDAVRDERPKLTRSKMDAVLEHVIATASPKRPKLIFCHYRGEIDMLVDGMKAAGLNVGAFDGRVKQAERAELLKEPLDVLVLQVRTGCEGLNLQRYNDIYFISPHWNPAVEDQAVARCHRMGQTEPVRVYHFLMEGFDKEERTCTLDVHSQSVQDGKRELMRLLDHETGPDGKHESNKEKISQAMISTEAVM